ncbi:major facilitator superfamily domain-containing protein, partial [Limtongia smithiae]|uniref:major facilitator superfamily domain-containing protein n=1 Tax=Limtongia smithiae TaxID=1125753 RepID=UPI0034CDD2F0
RWMRKPSILIMLPATLIMSLASGSLISPNLNVTLTLVCRAHFAELSNSAEDFDESRCQIPDVHAKVSRVQMIIQLISGLLSAIVSPRLGAFSDRYGRKPALFIAALGPVLASAVYMSLLRSTYTYAYHFIFLAGVFDGSTGSIVSFMLISHAYVTDCTTPGTRAHAFSMLRAILFAGLSIGPAVSGYIMDTTRDIFPVVYFSFPLQILFGVYIVLVVPESISPEARSHAREMHRISSEFSDAQNRDLKYYMSQLNVLKPLGVLNPKDGTRRAVKKNLLILTASEIACYGCELSAIMIIMLYVELALGWPSSQTSYFMSVTSFARAMTLVFMFPGLVWLYQRYRPHVQHEVGVSKGDVFLIRLSFVFMAVSYILMAITKSSSGFMFAGALGAIGSFGSPQITSAITKNVSKENTGAVLGALALLQNAATIIGPIILSSVYSYTVGFFPQAIFLVVTGIYMAAFIGTLFLTEHAGGGLYDN